MDIKRKADILLPDLLKVLEEGGVLVTPTETAYGLIADSTNKEAVNKIYKIKGRDFKKPLPVVCSSIEQVKNFFILDKSAEDLARKYWPGPLSIILAVKSKTKTARKVRVNLKAENAAVRVTSFNFLQDLARRFGFPLTATSANISGHKTLYQEEEVAIEFENCRFKPDLVILSGDLPQVLPSTVVELVNGKIKVLRFGAVKVTDYFR